MTFGHTVTEKFKGKVKREVDMSGVNPDRMSTNRFRHFVFLCDFCGKFRF